MKKLLLLVLVGFFQNVHTQDQQNIEVQEEAVAASNSREETVFVLTNGSTRLYVKVEESLRLAAFTLAALNGQLEPGIYQAKLTLPVVLEVVEQGVVTVPVEVEHA